MSKKEFIEKLQLIVNNNNNVEIYFQENNVTISWQGPERENDWYITFSFDCNNRAVDVRSHHVFINIKFANILYGVMSAIEQYNGSLKKTYIINVPQVWIQSYSVEEESEEAAVKKLLLDACRAKKIGDKVFSHTIPKDWTVNK